MIFVYLLELFSIPDDFDTARFFVVVSGAGSSSSSSSSFSNGRFLDGVAVADDVSAGNLAAKLKIFSERKQFREIHQTYLI